MKSIFSCLQFFVIFFIVSIAVTVASLRSGHVKSIKSTNAVPVQVSATNFQPNKIKVLPENYLNEGIPYLFNHMAGSHRELPVGLPITSEEIDFDMKKKVAFNMNVGKALDTLRRELPMVFVTSRGDLDFSIFANQITLIDGSQHIGHGKKIELSKSLYIAAVKSFRMAAAFSSIYPSVNVRKIEYDEASQAIKCLVNVILPDSVKVDGQSVWEGMFYFGLDQEGLINTHIFDRKIETLKPAPINVKAYPWLRAAGPTWSPELVGVGRSGRSLF